MALKQPLRSLLFVPGNKPRMLEKARSMDADAIILDLEDGVPVGEKEAARETVRQALESGEFRPQVILRVNGFATGLTEQDLKGAFGPGVQAICLPKTEGLLDVLHLSPLITEIEQVHGRETGSVDIVAMVETARGVLHAHEIPETCWRVRAMALGGEDLARDLGALRTKTGEELAHAQARMVLAARATGVLAIDTIWTDLDDLDGLRGETRRARQLGYSGKLLIHPNQVAPVHTAFTPTAEEIDYARRVVQAFEAAGQRGDGVIALDGQMIDAPVVARARETLKLAGE